MEDNSRLPVGNHVDPNHPAQVSLPSSSQEREPLPSSRGSFSSFLHHFLYSGTDAAVREAFPTTDFDRDRFLTIQADNSELFNSLQSELVLQVMQRYYRERPGSEGQLNFRTIEEESNSLSSTDSNTDGRSLSRRRREYLQYVNVTEKIQILRKCLLPSPGSDHEIERSSSKLSSSADSKSDARLLSRWLSLGNADIRSIQCKVITPVLRNDGAESRIQRLRKALLQLLHYSQPPETEFDYYRELIIQIQNFFKTLLLLCGTSTVGCQLKGCLHFWTSDLSSENYPEPTPISPVQFKYLPNKQCMYDKN